MIFARLPSPISDLRLWSTQSDGYYFVISEELRTGKDFEGWTGFHASYTKTASPEGPITQISGGPFENFNDAKQACENKLKQLIGLT